MKQNRLILNRGGRFKVIRRESAESVRLSDVNKIPSQVLLPLRLCMTTCLNYCFVTISDAAVN